MPVVKSKQMLVPATAEDLKKHGQISIITKTEEQEEGCEIIENTEGKFCTILQYHKKWLFSIIYYKK